MGTEIDIDTLNLRDRMLVLKSDDLSEFLLTSVRDQVKAKGGLGVIGISSEEDVYTEDIQNRLVVIRTDTPISVEGIDIIKKEMKDKGALGVLFLGSKIDIESFSIEDLEKIIAGARLKKVVNDLKKIEGSGEGANG